MTNPLHSMREAVARLIYPDAWVDEKPYFAIAGYWDDLKGESLAKADAILALTNPAGEDRLAGNRAAFEAGEIASEDGPTPELMHIVRMALENEAHVTREARVKVIDAVINMYHTTRLSETPASSHILTKPTVQRAFAELAAATKG